MLNLQAINVLPALGEALEAPAERRLDIFRERVMEPLRPFWEPFMSFMAPGSMNDGSDPTMNAARTFGYFSPELDLDQGRDALGQFDQANTWQTCVDAIRRGWSALEPESHGIRIDPLQFSFMLGNPVAMNAQAGSYTGYGGTPGLIIVMAWPTDFNLPRLPAATAHELNHNVRFSFEPFMMHETTVGQYMVAEGLAESFAAQLFGHDMVGPWACALSDEQIEVLKPRYRDALEVKGFDEVRGYIFGDWAAEKAGYKAQNLPDFAGYAMGYRLVQSYLERTGTTAAQATYVPWQEIVERSAFL